MSCQKESIINPLSSQQQNTEIQAIQQKFTLVNYQDSLIKNNLKVNWNNFVKANNMNAKVIKTNLDDLDDNLSLNSSVNYEFSTNMQSKISSTKDTTAFYSKTPVLASIDKNNNNITFTIINYSSSKNKDFEHINLNSLNNFNRLYDYYWKRYHPTWNHDLMASHYRKTIADTLQEFDNNRLSYSTYEAIAWAGLGKLDNNKSTIAWDNLSPSEKQAITSLINQYFFNGPSNCN